MSIGSVMYDEREIDRYEGEDETDKPMLAVKKVPCFIEDDGVYYPEGGFRAWVVILGCFCGFVPVFGMLNSVSVIETYLSTGQLSEVSSSTIGWIFSIYSFINFASCIFSGTYFDRNGARLPLIFGSVLHVGGLFAMADARKVWQFVLSFSVVCGLGNGILLSPLVSVPSHYFLIKRGTAIAIATTGGSVGGIIYPILLRKFFSMTKEGFEFYGFVWGLRSLGFINLFLLIIGGLFAKERLPHRQLTEKEQATPVWRRILSTYFFQSFDIHAFKDLKYLFCVLGTTFGELSILSGITYIGSYALEQGLSQSDSYMIITVYNVAGIPGRWVPGYFSDIFGRFNVAITTLFCLTFVTFVMWLPFGTTRNNLYGFCVLYGFFSGSIFSTLPVCCGQISKTEEFGRRYSTMYFVVAFGTLVAAPITGAIIGTGETSIGYQHYVIWCGVTSFAAALCFMLSKFLAVGIKFNRF